MQINAAKNDPFLILIKTFLHLWYDLPLQATQMDFWYEDVKWPILVNRKRWITF